MRLALVFCALVFCGCGVLDDPGPAVPRGPDPALTRPDPNHVPVVDVPHVRPRAVAPGTIAVVDITGVVGVRPRVLETASDARLLGLVWDRWGADGAVAHGTLRSLECPSTCATGVVKTIPATVHLTGVTRCSGRLYFASATVTLAGAKPPATYLRAPC